MISTATINDFRYSSILPSAHFLWLLTRADYGAKQRIECRDIWPNMLRLQSRLPAILFVDLPSDNNQLRRLGRSINLAAIIYAGFR
jgi:hypothetical protein